MCFKSTKLHCGLCQARETCESCAFHFKAAVVSFTIQGFFFFLQSAHGLKVYLKSSECLKTETVVNVGAICQYNYSGERSVFINKQDQFFFPKVNGYY